MGSAKKHIVKQGECMSSIAFENGFFWNTLWSHPENAALKESRDSPFVLRPGDVVHVPALTLREVSAATGAKHTFRRKGVPAKLRLRLLVMDKPLANLPYVLTYGDRKIEGTTSAQGLVEAFVPPDMPRARLTVGEGDDVHVYNIAPRTLNPSRDVDGIQARLANLGYYSGPSHGELDAATIAALKRFQSDHDLEATGKPDEATASALSERHTSSG
ncbi:peptidoglycan-binding domain-containing protein [Sorangium sp. So ce726]|uniref:peptidoglycan-binding domain-containing protein n=1 Tax=Sorangium sp. So ce726 TaxID=3133319 RepID=UPI003F63E37F